MPNVTGLPETFAAHLAKAGNHRIEFWIFIVSSLNLYLAWLDLLPIPRSIALRHASLNGWYQMRGQKLSGANASNTTTGMSYVCLSYRVFRVAFVGRFRRRTSLRTLQSIFPVCDSIPLLGGAAVGALGTSAGYEINSKSKRDQLEDDYRSERISRREYEARKSQLEKGSIIY